MGPVVRSTSRPSWIRLSQSQCYYWKGESGGYILSFTFKFDVDERYEFAYCFPYDYSRLQSKIRALPSSVEHRVLAHTLQKRNWLETLKKRFKNRQRNFAFYPARKKHRPFNHRFRRAPYRGHGSSSSWRKSS